MAGILYTLTIRPLEIMFEFIFSVAQVIFNDNGFDVTVCDPPFAGYQWTPDISIYDDYEDINAYITEGRYNTNSKESAEQTVYLRNRNFFCNAVMRVLPLFLWRRIYDYGYYNTSVTDQAVESISEVHGACLDQFDLKAEDGMDVEGFILLLLMKDFNSTGFTVSDEFMTNADGVYFAIDDVIDNPVNPFTGNILDETDKYDGK